MARKNITNKMVHDYIDVTYTKSHIDKTNLHKVADTDKKTRAQIKDDMKWLVKSYPKQQQAYKTGYAKFMKKYYGSK